MLYVTFSASVPRIFGSSITIHYSVIMSYPEDEQWRPERRDAASQLPEKIRAVACKSLAREPLGLY